MKILIVSCGEGHTISTIRALMSGIQNGCIAIGAPHTIISATLDDKVVPMLDPEQRAEWIQDIAAGKTNMGFKDWQDEKALTQRMHQIVMFSYPGGFRLRPGERPTLEEEADRFVAMFPEGLPTTEDERFRFTDYATDYGKWHSNGSIWKEGKAFPGYADWVQAQLESKQ